MCYAFLQSHEAVLIHESDFCISVQKYFTLHIQHSSVVTMELQLSYRISGAFSFLASTSSSMTLQRVLGHGLSIAGVSRQLSFYK
jgi:hypothetical protein